MKKILLIIFFIACLSSFCFSEETQESVNLQEQPPPILLQINNLKKDFNWASQSTMNIVVSSILLCPDVFQGYAIAQYRELLSQKKEESGAKYISRKMVLKTLEELMPQSELDNAKEILGVSTKLDKVPSMRQESGINAIRLYPNTK